MDVKLTPTDMVPVLEFAFKLWQTKSKEKWDNGRVRDYSFEDAVKETMKCFGIITKRHLESFEKLIPKLKKVINELV